MSLDGLIRDLQRLKAAGGAVPKKGSKSKKKKVTSTSTPGTTGTAVTLAVTAGKGKKKKKSKSAPTMERGEINISMFEMLSSVKTGADGTVTGSVLVDPSNLPWLSNISKAFERVRWHSVSLEWRPSVGANTDGSFAMGFDWGDKSADRLKARKVGGREVICVHELDAIDRMEVLSCTPCVDTPVWQRVPNFVIPGSRLQSRTWYEIPDDPKSTTVGLYDRAPGSLVYQCSGAANKSMGEVWIRYGAKLFGTRKV